ncbi:MAG: hypothetical protein HY202_04880 [Nitrospirae bacterium]|nr:hypothetical protein [Nitrospirota bacterium]
MKEQQVIMDRNQSNEAASKHAMSSPSISKIESWDEANKFVHNELDTARQLRESNHVESLKHLGNAIHTMQDTSSPMHENYQKWDVNESGFDKFEHAIGESIDPGPGSKLDTETRRAWDIYQSPYPVPNEILPKPK